MEVGEGPKPSVWRWSATQRSVAASLKERLECVSMCSDKSTKFECVKLLMKGDDLYHIDSCAVQPYDSEKLKVLKGRVTPKVITDLLPHHVARKVHCPGTFMLKGAGQVEADRQEREPFIPY